METKREIWWYLWKKKTRTKKKKKEKKKGKWKKCEEIKV